MMAAAWDTDVETRYAQQIAAIEASNDGIAITDADGVFTFMNLAHATMFGYPDKDSLIGKPWSVLYTETELARLGREAMPILNETHRWRGEAIGKSIDGLAIQQEISLSLSSDGGIVCVTRDIGKRLAEEREKALLREQVMVAQRQHAVGQLAIELAHDFNNLIGVIAGTAGLLQVTGDAAVSKHAERIETAAGAAAALISKLMVLGNRERNTRLIDLRTVIGSVRDLVSPTLSQDWHHVVSHFPDVPVVVEADSGEVIQVMMNLALNARDALPDGKTGNLTLRLDFGEQCPVRGELVVGRMPNRATAVLEVIDTGCGIAPDIINRLFEPFFTTKGERGTGLGLPAVARIVTDAGGAITLSTEPGIGTRFQVWWPRTTAGKAIETMRTVQSGDVPTSLKDKAVLVVDDNRAVAETIAAMFQQAGAVTTVFEDPGEALATIRTSQHPWDMMVTDYSMPQMTGAQLALEIKTFQPELPMILLTALPQVVAKNPEDVINFDVVLGKPVNQRSLIESAQFALARKHASHPSLQT